MAPAVSLVIATFNHGRCLRDAIDSALAQTRAPEIIVVDDGSTDDTPAILAGYGEAVRAVRQDNRGLAAARNAGLAVARGRCVAFLDADDVIAPTKLAEQAAVLDAHPDIGWTYCDVRLEESATGCVTSASARFRYADRRLDGHLFGELLSGNFIPVMAPLVRREALERAGGFDERLTAMEDWDFLLRLSLVASARYLPAVLATYRIAPGGMSEDRARMDASRFAVLDKCARAHREAIVALGVGGRRIVADTHNWFAYRAYGRGEWAEARRRLVASLRALPWQGRAPVVLTLSVLRAARG